MNSRSPDPRRAVTAGSLRWAGTFHAIANRLLRRHALPLGLDPSFTVLDRSDAEDLLNLTRADLGLSKRERRFPQKATCLAIYSRCVNSGEPVQECLEEHFPWCSDWEAELRTLFRHYVEAKQQRSVLDYDDLLLYWYHLMNEPALAAKVSAAFDHVLVDEYQDTNSLQASILLALEPRGSGLTVVGDDAQSIYSFRAATVRNILDFPAHFDPPAEVITLEQNYRSTQPILDAANAVIELAKERYTKVLFSERASDQKPRLIAVEDEAEQAEYVADRVLLTRESGVPLKRQAVLFRAAHHSDLLEVELGRRNIPFVKYGGLKFLEAAHVKDMMCLLRWAENPRDGVAGFRVLQLLPGIGPATARAAIDHLDINGEGLGGLRRFRPPASAQADWPGLTALLESLTKEDCDWPAQVGEARQWYEPHLERLYDASVARAGDLEQLELVAGQYDSRERFLSELTLDPPEATGDHAGVPHLDEDYLILSTIHSAKGQEWDSVYILNAVDGCIPSDMATGKVDEIEEERRLLYVAMTRAERELYIMRPLRFYVIHQRRHGDRHVYAPLTRFLAASTRSYFDAGVRRRVGSDEEGGGSRAPRVDVAARLREMW
jgi:DNA helicase-2/ATP-dependent DNA helicase PcrA